MPSDSDWMKKKNSAHIPILFHLCTPMSSPEIILIDKPYRWTSFDVVKKIRNLLTQKQKAETGIKPKLKVGHAGTLDPLATGLLIVCTGSFTKRIDEIQAAEKEYTGTIVLGATRPSYDMETEIDQHFDISHIDEKKIAEVALSFTGNILQTPPAHSAVKVDGVRAYKKARKGHAVEIKPKTIHIREFEITSVNLPEVHFRVVCSKGTYIRSLANDLGKALQSGAYLSALCRTRIGEFSLKDALNMDAFRELHEKSTTSS
jgi:tRNA pseudouridine55 synthase